MEDRTLALEERAAWLEHRLGEVEDMLRAAFTRIDQLEAELKQLAERPAPGEGEVIGWEPPPHY